MSIHVVAIEDDDRYRGSLERLFEHAAGFTLLGSHVTAESALDSLEAAGRGGPRPSWDLVLMDLELPGIGGIEATRQVKELLDDVRVVVLTVFEEPRTVLEAICAGADGYLVKRMPPEELLEELRSVVAGGAPLSGGVARTVLNLLRHLRDEPEPRSPSRLDLTPREQEVLRCLVRGMSYKRVARELDISLDTVRSHVRSVYSKLQVHSVSQAVSRAIREGLV
ncbi:MAG: response regulator [Gemmatimonadetes bacterium]|nr:response regulator transcription factor [Gemmatimonadota bacterium]NIR81493.1 response regulator transcription factor [Gemmatimonadota bacterium]NIT90340.1 response regulator transcription factor [Gemmatimonadota bacterium]NIU34165.1 response regulator transcription factor [Gemmatimonadota bacterium]NIU38316.1 response regulator [Gemmatimonadota bacterium]